MEGGIHVSGFWEAPRRAGGGARLGAAGREGRGPTGSGRGGAGPGGFRAGGKSLSRAGTGSFRGEGQARASWRNSRHRVGGAEGKESARREGGGEPAPREAGRGGRCPGGRRRAGPELRWAFSRRITGINGAALVCVWIPWVFPLTPPPPTPRTGVRFGAGLVPGGRTSLQLVPEPLAVN